MKAVVCRTFGPVEALELGELPDPVAGPGEVVVRVAATGLNFFDTLMVAGKYQIRPPFPFSPGAEIAGTVESVGVGVTTLAPGDRVFGQVGHGGAAELVLAKADELVKMPAGMDFDQAAGLTVTYGTTYHALRDRGRLKPGETLAVLGASGGVGIAAVQLGKIMGARVVACASSDEKLAFARAEGADETINYGREDLRDALKRVGGEHGIDVLYDPVGGKLAEPALRGMAWDGRYLVIGFASGEIPRLPLNLALLKGCAIVGVFWGTWAKRERAAYRRDLAEMAAWSADGRLTVRVQKAYPLAEAIPALQSLAAGKVMGKIVLRP